MSSRDTHSQPENEPQPPAATDAAEGTQDWQEPKLTFIQPSLTSHGPLTAVTGQFFGAFSPPVD